MKCRQHISLSVINSANVCQFVSVAQLAEHLTFNQGGVGSIPIGRTL